MKNLSDYGAAADARLGFDGAMTASSTSLTSASGPFVAGDVGKTIIVAGAGASGADLRTSIASFTSATQVGLTNSASATVSNAGFTYGTNASTAVQNALNDIATAGGGSLLIDGRYLLAGSVFKDLLGVGTVSLVGQGDGRLYIAAGKGVTALSLANAERLIVQGIVFVGGAQSYFDARRVLNFSGCNALVTKNLFYSLSTKGDSDGAIIAATQGTGLALSDNVYLGCTSPNAVVFADSFLAFSAERDIFVDAATLDGISMNKLVNNSPAAWVKVGPPQFAPISATSDSVVRVTDVKMDEGAIIGLLVDPGNSARVPHVLVDGLQQATFDASSGIGIKVRHADVVEILRSSIGTVESPAPAHTSISVFDCGDVVVSDLRSDAPTGRIIANALGSLTLENSYGLTEWVLAAVGQFILIQHGIPVTPSRPTLMSDNSLAIITNGNTAELSSSAPAVWQNVAHSVAAFNGTQSFAGTWTVVALATGMAVGLNRYGGAAGAFNSIPISFVLSGGKWNTVYATAPTSTGVNAAAGDVLSISYTGGNVIWKINGVQVRSATNTWTMEDIVVLDIDMVGGQSGKVTVTSFASL